MRRDEDAPARLRAPKLALLRDTLGDPREAPEKLRRLGKAIRAHFDRRAVDARLARLRELGVIDAIPTRLQMVVGAIDVLRFWIVPASAEYYAHKGIDFRFHQLLRFLDDPASLVDPIGLASERDVIIGHLMQVVHTNPRYDLELLEAHERGLDELEAQLRAMLDGTHPRAASIGAIVEEPDYHARLLAYVQAFRRDRDAPAPLRENVAASAHFRRLEKTFGSITTQMRYVAGMPTTLRGAALHVLRAEAP